MDNSLQIVNTNCEMQEWADKIAVATFLYVLGAEKTMFLYLLFTIGNRRFLTEFQAENLGLSRFLFQPDSMERTFGNQKLCQLVHCSAVGSLCTAGCAALKHNRQFFKGGAAFP